MMAVANKSLALLCFLLAIATSQAEAACIDVCIKRFAVSPSATNRDVVARTCTAKCAPVENQPKMTDALLTSKTEDDNRVEAAVAEEKEKLLISLNDQLKQSTTCPTLATRLCYNTCRQSGTSQQTCALLCGCTRERTEPAIVEEKEKLLISLNDQQKLSANCPTVTARLCYNNCRQWGRSQQICALLCGCTQERTEAEIVEEKEKLAEELKDVDDASTATQ